MRALTAAELLAAWERGRAQPPVEQALVLLVAACPEVSIAQIAALPIGLRDERLLTLREWTLGSAVASVAQCPRCGERLELAFAIGAIRAAPPSEAPLELHLEGQPLRFRLPTSADLLALDGHSDPVTVQRRLVERCYQPDDQASGLPSIELWPPELFSEVAALMAQADPQADVELALSCPTCGHDWQVAFDIVSFFWAEIDAWAYQLLRDVHMLALAYGWREADILALSPWRRQCYLEMVGR